MTTAVSALKCSSNHTRVNLRKLWRSPLLQQSLSTSASQQNTEGGRGKVLAIRREETNVWERRSPLNPNYVQSLVREGVKVSPCMEHDWKLHAMNVCIICVHQCTLTSSAGLGATALIIEFLLQNKGHPAFLSEYMYMYMYNLSCACSVPIPLCHCCGIAHVCVANHRAAAGCTV